MICGHIGCDRFHEKHAILHYESSGHAYSMELETQRVWDYVNNQYVHRLIQDGKDGEIVEFPCVDNDENNNENSENNNENGESTNVYYIIYIIINSLIHHVKMKFDLNMNR